MGDVEIEHTALQRSALAPHLWSSCLLCRSGQRTRAADDLRAEARLADAVRGRRRAPRRIAPADPATPTLASSAAHIGLPFPAAQECGID